MALFKKKTARDESYYLASQWQLMWRKLQKHKLARFSLVLLIILYIGALFADFFAPYGLEEFSSLYSAVPSAAVMVSPVTCFCRLY